MHIRSHAVLTSFTCVFQAKGSNQELEELGDTVTARRQRTGARRQRERDDHRQRRLAGTQCVFARNITYFGMLLGGGGGGGGAGSLVLRTGNKTRGEGGGTK